MPLMNTPGLAQHYERHGSPERPSILLVSGLGGVAASWGPQIELLARDFHVVAPDQRGTGRTERALDGYTTRQLAADMAALVQGLEIGPVHVVGSSTGGAIAQQMALHHRDCVSSLTIASSFARFDAYMHRQFEIRGVMAADWDKAAMFAGYSLFLFSPRYARENPDKVQGWIDRAAASPSLPEDRDIALKRISMIARHDTLAELPTIGCPTLVLCGEQNHCTPMALSEEIAAAIPGAELRIIQDAGELVELEMPERFAELVGGFVMKHT